MTSSLPITEDDRVVITGIGMHTSVGTDRESVWRAVQRGTSGIQRVDGGDDGMSCLKIGAPADVELEFPGQLKVLALCHRVAVEAIDDAALDWNRINCDRFGCAISSHFGDFGFLNERAGRDIPDRTIPWWEQWLPNTACEEVARRHHLYGPRLSHSAACASGLVEILAASRSIRAGQCDIALAGSAEVFTPIMAAGFAAMRVLADHDDPRQACRPFDAARSGMVMGEGAAMFVLERLSHALDRGAPIYAEVMAGRMGGEAHHLSNLDVESDTLCHVLKSAIRKADIDPSEIQYINAHGTGTRANDRMETRGIRKALGSAADGVWVSSTKSMLGHLIMAAGSVETAITTLALRDGFTPPTLNLTDPDPECDLDCVPLVGRSRSFDLAMKVSVAFGGHIAAVVLRRWKAGRQPQAMPWRATAAAA